MFHLVSKHGATINQRWLLHLIPRLYIDLLSVQLQAAVKAFIPRPTPFHFALYREAEERQNCFSHSFTADQRTKKGQPWEQDYFFGMLLGQHGGPAFHPHLHQKLCVLQDGWLVSVSTYLERDRLTKSTSTEHSMVIQLYLQERKVNRVGAAALTNVSVYCTASKIIGVYS